MSNLICVVCKSIKISCGNIESKYFLEVAKYIYSQNIFERYWITVLIF